MSCNCANCRRWIAYLAQPYPTPSAAESLALNRDYEARRRRYRTEHPHMTRKELAEEDA